MSSVCVVGLGHIGLPTAVTLARHGHTVLGVDTNQALVESVRQGRTSFHEPGLSEELALAVGNGALTVGTAPAEADAYVISVPTPVDGDTPVLTHIEDAAGAVGGVLSPGALVILESTVPPGTTAGVVRHALEATSGLRTGHDFWLAHCPERVLPGQILRELVENDRIIGGLDDEATRRAIELYRSFVTGKLVPTDATTAELVKLSENVYRDVNIALANDLAAVSEHVGADIWRVIEMANLHPRVNLHQPGPGVGGHCIPVAAHFLLAGVSVDAPVIRAARAVNASRPRRTVELARAACEGVDSPRVALLGVAYKAGVGDARATPATEIIEGLEAAGVEVRVHDPLASGFHRPLQTLDDALAGADLVLIVTDHAGFREIDPAHAATLVRRRVLLDGRNAVDLEAWRAAGFRVRRTGVADGA